VAVFAKTQERVRAAMGFAYSNLPGSDKVFMMRVSYRFWVVATLLFFVTANALRAQEPDAAVDVKAKFAEQFDAFNKIKDTAVELREKIEAASDDARPALIEEFKKLAESARTALGPLKLAAEAAYKAEPNKDERVTSVMLGIARDQITEDHYEDALATLKLLKDNKCDKKELACLTGVAAYCLNDFDTAEKELTAANENGSLVILPMASDFLADCEVAKKAWKEEQGLLEAEAKADDLPKVKIETNKGVIVIELFENEAPDTVGNFISLVEKKFYDGLTFHRVLGTFMAQAGCPHGDGSGGPGYTIFCETDKPNHRKHFRGTLSMAKKEAKDTGGSQFFLTFRRTGHLDGKHTVFGRVVEGLDILEKIQRRSPAGAGQPKADFIVKAEVIRKRDHAYEPKKAGEEKEE
jgi:cyclophilin family peptidyl-prolyl cis-trans isomerase